MNRTKVPDSTSRRSVERLRTRLDRLERLARPDVKDPGFFVEDACANLQRLYDDGRKPASILIRSGLLARQKRIHVEGDHDGAKRLKPPLAGLVRSRGVALRLELVALFDLQCRSRPTARLRPIAGEGDLLGLINLIASDTVQRGDVNFRRPRPKMRARQVAHALELLAGRRLVELGPTDENRSPFDTMWLNRETGPAVGKEPDRYKRPAADESVISVPIDFFTKGWVQVMTDSEIWNWLVFRHAAQMSTPSQHSASDLRVDAGDRLGIYDLSRDAWDTHLTLGRIGLMAANPGDITSEITARGQRFRKEPHAFDLDDQPLKADALSSVAAAVAAILEDALDD